MRRRTPGHGEKETAPRSSSNPGAVDAALSRRSEAPDMAQPPPHFAACPLVWCQARQLLLLLLLLLQLLLAIMASCHSTERR
jgi:hypothetical protein